MTKCSNTAVSCELQETGAPEAEITLSTVGAEVLRALVLGLVLRKTASGWSFVGPFQNPSTSDVSSDAVGSLLSYGYVQLGDDGLVSVTDLGQNALSHCIRKAVHITS